MKSVIETTMIPLSKIEGNRGQITGVPANPRILDADDYERLMKSVENNPEMLHLRELLVFPFDGRYIVLGGNMRLHVMTVLQFKDCPCKVIPECTPIEELRAIVIKDNVNFGNWDEELLRSDWRDEPLEDWGVYLAPEHEETEVKEDTTTLTLKFTPDQFRFIKQKLNEIDKDNALAIIKLLKDYGNEEE